MIRFLKSDLKEYKIYLGGGCNKLRKPRRRELASQLEILLDTVKKSNPLNEGKLYDPDYGTDQGKLLNIERIDLWCQAPHLPIHSSFGDPEHFTLKIRAKNLRTNKELQITCHLYMDGSLTCGINKIYYSLPELPAQNFMGMIMSNFMNFPLQPLPIISYMTPQRNFPKEYNKKLNPDAKEFTM